MLLLGRSSLGSRGPYGSGDACTDREPVSRRICSGRARGIASRNYVSAFRTLEHSTVWTGCFHILFFESYARHSNLLARGRSEKTTTCVLSVCTQVTREPDRVDASLESPCFRGKQPRVFTQKSDIREGCCEACARVRLCSERARAGAKSGRVRGSCRTAVRGKGLSDCASHCAEFNQSALREDAVSGRRCVTGCISLAYPPPEVQQAVGTSWADTNRCVSVLTEVADDIVHFIAHYVSYRGYA
ncbi:unnamed protein product [Rangifer tarandus platyrhynchus]|uniref:Uncharacterized protein n=1 Tax=Rangifer tarandus platyrhynchus TaxID=3082113 RepID=A0ABN8XJ76_RANTA|nr:unnamed protein product [Rangifer tarandus platyrhynchus]